MAEKIYKQLIEGNDDSMEVEEVTIKEMYKLITKSRPTKLRGNNELNMYVLRQIPELAAICLTHLVNSIIRTRQFPDILKISRIIPILKPKKDRMSLQSNRPMNNLNVLERCGTSSQESNTIIHRKKQHNT